MARKKTDENDIDENSPKNVAFYQEMVACWFTTQIEADKQAVGLSGLAIGLLVTLRDSIENGTSFVIWCFAGFFFFLSIAVALWVFYDNARYIEETLPEQDSVRENKISSRIRTMTIFIYALFGVGAMCTAFLAIISSTFMKNGGFCS